MVLYRHGARQRAGGCSGAGLSIALSIDSPKTCSALFEPVNQPGFLLKKARLKVRTDGAVNSDALVISIRKAEMLKNAADELQSNGSFTAGFFDSSSLVSANIDGKRFVKKKNGSLLFSRTSEKGKVRIMIKPDKGLIKVLVKNFTFPFDDYTHKTVCAFIDIGSFRYDIDLQDVDGQLKVSKKGLTFTVKNVLGNF